MEWQPIETAPKDGTKILVCLKDDPRRPLDEDQWRDRITTAYFNREFPGDPGDWFLAVPSYAWAHDDKCVPTDWMPLPDHPKEQ